MKGGEGRLGVEMGRWGGGKVGRWGGRKVGSWSFPSHEGGKVKPVTDISVTGLFFQLICSLYNMGFNYNSYFCKLNNIVCSHTVTHKTQTVNKRIHQFAKKNLKYKA